jgi:uncharacterized protein HemY
MTLRRIAAQVFLGKLDTVEEEARRNLMEHPTDINALLLLVEVLLLRHNQHPERDLAVHAFEQALRYDPISRRALRHLYMAYMQLGDTEHAQQVRRRLESLGGFLPNAE